MVRTVGRSAAAVAAVAWVVAVAGAPAVAAPIAVSDFEGGTDNWLVVSTEGYSGAPDWSATDGNPGGVIYDTDMDNGGWGFLAPPKFTGNHPDAYGQVLMFDFASDRIEHALAPVALADSTGIGILTHVATPGAVNTWAHREVVLDTSQGWVTYNYLTGVEGGAADADDIAAVLADLTYLFLGAEFANGYDNDGTYQFGELVGYDNVVLMPDPGTGVLLALGLAGLIARRRRRAG